MQLIPVLLMKNSLPVSNEREFIVSLTVIVLISVMLRFAFVVAQKIPFAKARLLVTEKASVAVVVSGFSMPDSSPPVTRFPLRPTSIPVVLAPSSSRLLIDRLKSVVIVSTQTDTVSTETLDYITKTSDSITTSRLVVFCIACRSLLKSDTLMPLMQMVLLDNYGSPFQAIYLPTLGAGVER